MIYVGIDLGGMSAKSAVFQDGKMLLKERVVTNPSDGLEGVARKLAALAEDVTVHAGLDFADVQAIGIGSPGVIDSAAGVVVKWSNYRWLNAPLGERVSSITGKPVYVTNDANAAALGEAKFGAGAKYKDCILITLGTGVGSGIVLNGKLFEGFYSAGGEAGHMTLVVDGKPCGCGRKGCFEQYASATALIAQTREAMLDNPDSILWEITNGSLDKVDGFAAFKGAKFGDEAAGKIVDRYIKYLGEGIANLVNIFRPQAIMLGGGVSNQGENLLVPLRAYVDKQIYVSTKYAPLDIVKAELGNDAGIYGACAYAMQREEAK
ncbi:MAG: ROK family protein [Clostridia bacterium]|nr:ROK family protein [Clostridia bacterium]